MAKLIYDPVYNPDMEAWSRETNDHYGNWNAAYRQFLGNDAALKTMIEDRGLSVVNGQLCITYESED